MTKKLDALEEFRIQREQLMARFEEQESKIEAQKGEYEGRIYDLEKRHIQVLRSLVPFQSKNIIGLL